jgi:phage host-nuclease inhibitor protein Gam
MVKQPAKKKVTQQAYQTALSAYVKNELDKRALLVKRDKEAAKIVDKYNGDFERIEKEQKEFAETLQQYADDNRQTLFGDQKSIKDKSYEIGFRSGKLKVEILEGQTEESVLALLKKKLPDYIRTTEAIAKDKLISDAKDANVLKHLEKCGLKFASGEVFFIKVLDTK